jgi:hypothetical protein
MADLFTKKVDRMDKLWIWIKIQIISVEEAQRKEEYQRIIWAIRI